jgi:hypothetical protein
MVGTTMMLAISIGLFGLAREDKTSRRGDHQPPERHEF